MEMTDVRMEIVDCNPEAHGASILAILNDVIETSTALFEYEPRSADDIDHWFESKAKAAYPVLGAVDGRRLLGFATYGMFRDWPAYKYTIEHSVYVDRTARCRGIGTALMTALVSTAENQQYRTMIGGIDADNKASIALHVKLGFRHAGTIEQAGFKFGRWLDLVFYQRMLNTALEPATDKREQYHGFRGRS